MFVVLGNHQETGEVFVFDSLSSQLILGYPWLRLQNPLINWVENRIEKLVEKCSKNSLNYAISPGSTNKQISENIDISIVSTLSTR